MVHRCIIPPLLVVSCLFAQQELCNILIMDLFGQYITEEDLQSLRNTLEKELNKTGKFIIHDRSKINEVLDEYGVQQEECRTIPWIVRIGRKLGMDKVVLGSVNKLGRTITVNVRTIDMEKRAIDRSATEVCRDCSIDVIFLKKIKIIAGKLAGLEVSDRPDDSLFHFASGPLVELKEREDDTDVKKQMKDKLFEDWRKPVIKRKYKVGIFLYTVGSVFVLVNNIIWGLIDHPPDTPERLPVILAETGITFIAIPFLAQAARSKGAAEFRLLPRSTRKEITPGAKIGIAVSRLNPNTYQKPGAFNTKAGINASVFLTIPMSHFFAFQPELAFVQRGYRTEEESTQFKKGSTKFNYVEMPLLFKSRLPLSGRFRPNVLLGFSPAYLLGAKTDSEYSLDDVSRFDLGLDYGIELTWELNRGTLILEMRSREGLIDLGENQYVEPEQKNRSVLINAGYSF